MEFPNVLGTVTQVMKHVELVWSNSVSSLMIQILYVILEI